MYNLVKMEFDLFINTYELWDTNFPLTLTYLVGGAPTCG